MHADCATPNSAVMKRAILKSFTPIRDVIGGSRGKIGLRVLSEHLGVLYIVTAMLQIMRLKGHYQQNRKPQM